MKSIIAVVLLLLSLVYALPGMVITPTRGHLIPGAPATTMVFHPGQAVSILCVVVAASGRWYRTENGVYVSASNVNVPPNTAIPQCAV